MHPIELDDVLASFQIVVDTREQKWAHIESSLKATQTPYTVAKLNYGDYTCEAKDSQKQTISLADKYVIERKRNLDELVGNFTKGRERFDREFKRALADKAKVFLMIEDPDLWRNIEQHNYRSKMPPKTLLATLCSWQAKYNITVISCSQKDSGTLIKAILWYALRDYLRKEGDQDEP